MSEYRIKYEDKTMKLFERCIKLGYKPYFQMPHKTPRGYEIETLLIIEWIETKRIMFSIALLLYSDKWNCEVHEIDDHERTPDGYIFGDFTTKQEAQLAAIEKGLEILESKEL